MMESLKCQVTLKQLNDVQTMNELSQNLLDEDNYGIVVFSNEIVGRIVGEKKWTNAFSS